MTTAISQHTRHLGRHLGFLNKNNFSKTAANFLEIGQKHVFTVSNRNIIKKRAQKKKLEQFFQKVIFLFLTLICINNFAYIICDGVIKLTSKEMCSLLDYSYWELRFNGFKASTCRLEEPIGAKSLDVQGLTFEMKIKGWIESGARMQGKQ